MIEIRSTYLIKLQNIPGALDSWKISREKVWPLLNWSGRLQQMLHGHTQQSLFVWSSEWNNLGEWEASMARTKDSPEFQEWYRDIQDKFLAYGSEREIFSVLDPVKSPDITPGKLEVRSSYVGPMAKVRLAQEHMRKRSEIENWSGQCLQMLHGKAAQTIFVLSTTHDSLADWELGIKQMANNESAGQARQAWFDEWINIVDFGGSREIYRNF